MQAGKGPIPPMMSNGTHCPSQKLHPALPWLMLLFYVCGFLLNSLSLWLFGSCATKWNSSAMLQFNLALSDVLVTPIAPLIVLYSLWDDWPFGLFLCQLKVFLLSVHVYGGICFLTLISIHRCSTVARHRGPTQSRMANPRFVRWLCVAVWVGLLLQGLPFFGLLDTWRDASNSTKCLSIHQPNMAMLFFSYNLAVLVVGVVLPFCVFGTCYVWLGVFLCGVKTQGAQGQGVRAHAARVIAACLFIFTLCYVPLHITRTVGVTIALFYPSQCQLLNEAEVSYYISFTLSSANCCLDPLLYCFSSRRFRQSLRRTLANARNRYLTRNLHQQPSDMGENPVEPVSTVATSDMLL
ncbi:hypothetical protein AAFF_G00009760 [Aldrovandia affinis]|uniref:G-protein coupled receptors family 1 profile domain-containing protein n=1 Tax=Aldrovandia affinis TaxID=143900 RepID=A0AAD7WHG5_9TELE|nr:hypothetical protein AAFF_G00009760 [Aldrovandia affinis]